MALDLKGRWVTISGRKVFIEEGQSLKDAMNKSKKFDKAKEQAKKYTKTNSQQEKNTNDTNNEEKTNLDYQGKNDGSGKPTPTGKSADTIIEEVRNWEKEGKNSVVIEKNKEAIETLKSIEGNPDAKVKIYRATPGDNINDGDWVFLDKKHAEEWTKTPIGTPKPGFKVVEMETEAKNLEWTGKNLEFGYRKNGISTENDGSDLEHKDFSKSKIKKTLYHGTSKDFEDFSSNKIGSSTGNDGLFGKGHYFTENEKLAQDYIRDSNNNYANNGYIYKTKINMQKPFEWKSIKTEEQFNEFKNKMGFKDEGIYWNKTTNEIHSLTSKSAESEFSEKLKKHGYDGIIYKYDNTTSEYVVFDNNQIKIEKKEKFSRNTGANNKNPYMNAYKEYMKEHPNSKMTFENFKKNLE